MRPFTATSREQRVAQDAEACFGRAQTARLMTGAATGSARFSHRMSSRAMHTDFIDLSPLTRRLCHEPDT